MKTRQSRFRAARAWRWLRRAARVLVACFALIAVLGGGLDRAFAAVVALTATPSCHCPHDDGERRACPCCNHDQDGSGGCLPTDRCASHATALAPAIDSGDVIPLPALIGLADVDDVPTLLGRAPHLRIERPPRG